MQAEVEADTGQHVMLGCSVAETVGVVCDGVWVWFVMVCR